MSTREVDLARLVDKEAIRDLVQRYSMYGDLNMPEELVALFTDDCEVSYGGDWIHGKAALLEVVTQGLREAFAATCHTNGYIVIDFDGDDRARLRTSLYAWHLVVGDVQGHQWGYYDDVVVRDAEHGWRFKSRLLRVSGTKDFDGPWHPTERR